MSKKAMKEREDLIRGYEEQIALSWPRYPRPEPMVRREGYEPDWEKAETGWAIFGSYVYPTKRLGTLYKESRTGDGLFKGIASRGNVELFRTKSDALRAMRWDRCRHVAAELHRLDLLIRTADVMETAGTGGRPL